MSLKRTIDLPLIACFAWMLFWFLANPHSIEESNVLDIWFLSKGLIYYKDFNSFHLPLGRLYLYIFHIVTNFDLRSGPFAALLMGILTVFTINYLGKRFFSNGARLVAITFFTLFFWIGSSAIQYTHEAFLGFMLSITLYFFFLALNKTFSKRGWFFFGLLIGLTELSSQISTITLLFLLTVLFIKIGKKWKLINLVLLLMGVIIPMLITFTYFMTNQAFEAFFFSNFTYYFSYRVSKQLDLTSLPYRQLVGFYFPLVVLTLIFLRKLILRRKIALYTTIGILLGISTIPFVVFSIYHPHHLLYGLPILAIISTIAYQEIKNNNLSLILMILFIVIVSADISQVNFDKFHLPPNFSIVNDTYPGDGMYEAISWVKVNTPHNAKIMVVGDPLFYLRSDRLPASRPSDGLPAAWLPLNRTEKEITATPPDLWITADDYTRRLAKDLNETEMIDFLNNQLKGYKKVYSEKGWNIWQKINS